MAIKSELLSSKKSKLLEEEKGYEKDGIFASDGGCNELARVLDGAGGREPGGQN
jgi:hypothetical protein